MSLSIYLKDPSSTYNTEPLYESNITHNLNIMADKAGIYKALWMPQVLGVRFAKDILITLKKGLELLLAEPNYFESFNSKNGWGTYDDFVLFVRNYIKAIEDYPESIIQVSL